MPPEKKVVKYGGNQDKNTFMPPETTGAMKRDNPFHWSLDELIEYKQSGVRPKMVLDDSIIFTMARAGVSIDNICAIFQVTRESFCNNDSFLTAHREGRAQIGAKNRALIVEQALAGSLQAQIYLDKMLGGDVNTDTVNINITQRPLEQVDTSTLIELVIPKPKEQE
jgi:hypothetical protein